MEKIWDQGYEGWCKYNRNWKKVNIFFFFLNFKDMLSEWFSGYYYLFIIRFIIIYLLSCHVI